MKRLFNRLQNKTSNFMLMFVLVSSMASCNSILNYDEGDCSVEYRVRFKYDYNMKYANAFSNEVRTVTLYAFDENGEFVYQRTEEGDKLKEDDYSMKVDIEPGQYHLVAWAGLDDDTFSIPLLTPGSSNIEELYVKANRETAPVNRSASGDENKNIVNRKLANLWHGESLQTFSRAGSQNVITIPLVKNTNNIRIVMQQMDGLQVDVSKYDFAIYDDNGLMNYDNTLLKDDLLTYQPYYRAQGGTDQGSRAGGNTNISVAVVQIKVARLMVDKNPILRIINRDTRDIILQIPLVQYLLLTEQEGNDMTPQEYLDRQDEYSMTFFLDENMSWATSKIIINGWTIKLNEVEL